MMEIKPRRPRRIFDRRSVFFSVVVVAMFAYIVFLLNNTNNRSQTGSRVAGSEQNIYRELANKLKSEKLYQQAIDVYRDYLQATVLPDETRANIHYMIGGLNFELHKYEDALTDFYAADLLGVEPAIQKDLNIKIINCLERLGRGFSAEYALKSKTALKEDKKIKPEGLIVAAYGDEYITMRDLDEQLEKLGEDQRKQFRDPQKKFQFLQQYLSMKLLARKAKKMGYDKDADILAKLDEIKSQLMVEKMVQAELKKNVSVDPEDIKLYYEAHKADYSEPESVEIAHILVDSFDKAEQIRQQLDDGAVFSKLAETESQDNATKTKGGVITGWLSLRSPLANGIDRSQLVKAALEADTGTITPVVQDEQGFHVVKVLEKRPAQQRPFEEVAQKVAQDYQVFKAEKIYRSMMENILKVEGVTINQEAFFGKTQNQIKPVDIKKIDEQK